MGMRGILHACRKQQLKKGTTMLHNEGRTTKTHSGGMRSNEDDSAEALRHVRNWIGEYLRPFWQIDMSDELDRYEYERVETGECYEETDGDVTYTVPVLRSVSYGRDEDVQAAAEALGFDCYCDECEHVVDWLMRQYDAVSKQLRVLRPDTGLPKGITDARKPAAPSMCREEADVVYVGLFDGEEPLTSSPWFPEGWTPEGYYEVLDEGGVGAVWQEYGEDFACNEFGLPNFLGDALVATSKLGGAR